MYLNSRHELLQWEVYRSGRKENYDSCNHEVENLHLLQGGWKANET
jgi:hypothetical protein